MIDFNKRRYANAWKGGYKLLFLLLLALPACTQNARYHYGDDPRWGIFNAADLFLLTHGLAPALSEIKAHVLRTLLGATRIPSLSFISLAIRSSLQVRRKLEAIRAIGIDEIQYAKGRPST